MRNDTIVVRGAHEHNLKNVDLELPHDQLIVFTGLSGSGKSSRVRHHLRRRAAPVRRVVVGVRPAVPRPDGQAGRRLHRRLVAGDLDRPEVRVAQPALDCRHDHRDLRLLAAAVRTHRCATLSELRAADHASNTATDRRPRAATAGRHALPSARARSPRPQGRPNAWSTSWPVRDTPGPGSTASCSTYPAKLKLERYEQHTIEVVVDRLVRQAGIERRLTDFTRDRAETRGGRGRGRDRPPRGRQGGRAGRFSRSPSTSRARIAASRSRSSHPELLLQLALWRMRRVQQVGNSLPSRPRPRDLRRRPVDRRRCDCAVVGVPRRILQTGVEGGRRRVQASRRPRRGRS